MQSQIRKLFCQAFGLAVVAVSLLALEASANAARLTVKVNQASNSAPLSGAQVCYNNSDNSIHDSKTTDSQGNAVFDNVPQGTLKLVASKLGFLGFETTINMGSGDRTETLSLRVGKGGPVCQPNAPPPPPPPPPPAGSANLTVLVGRTNSTVISGAAVCVASGSGAVRTAFTDFGGQATFNGINQGQVTITVASAGFTGESHTSTLGAAGGTALFRLSAGSGGPVCNAVPPPTPPGPATLAVTSFDWHVNRRTPLFFEIWLTFAATKTPGGPVVPTHYRVGESSDLSNTPWIAYPGGVIVFQLGYRGNSLTAYGQRTVHFQIKKDDITSPVASKTVNLQPVNISEFRFQGSDLSEMLLVADSHGFGIHARTVSVTENICGELEFRRNTLDFLGSQGSAKDRDWVKVMEITLVDSAARRFTAGWRVKSIEVGQSFDLSPSQAISGASDGNGFKVTIRHIRPRDPAADPGFCIVGVFPLKAIVLEGPADDMTLDQAKRWKNMFPSN
jgi:hypothetical protein